MCSGSTERTSRLIVIRAAASAEKRSLNVCIITSLVLASSISIVFVKNISILQPLLLAFRDFWRVFFLSRITWI